MCKKSGMSRAFQNQLFETASNRLREMKSATVQFVHKKRREEKLIYLEAAFEFCARLVHGLVAFQQLYDKYGKVLIRAWTHGDGH